MNAESDDHTGQAAPGERAEQAAERPSAWRRLAARLIDWAIHTLIVAVVATILLTTSIGEDWSGRALGTLFFGLTALLRGIFEIGFVGAKGATPGKLVMSLRVRTSDDGTSLVGWSAATVRGVLIDLPTLFGGLYYIVLIAAPNLNDTAFALWTILWVATWVFWLVEVLSIFGNSARQGLHDKVAKSVVVSK
ncbi:RDD family protein [Candidatus Poriferisodalis sp.]|uniref:RDD family protein n=1 Tax=Candidatus Poriferisodalis sp. TaxID=3101277 RepID=UPI003B01EEE4